MMETTPEQRVKRGCNFIILLTAILAAINASANGINSIYTQVFFGIFVLSIIAWIGVRRT
jgi:hypothetical protein